MRARNVLNSAMPDAAGSQRVRAAVSAPSQVTTQVRFGVLTRAAREPGQIGERRQPYMTGWRRIGRGAGQVDRWW
jgi:hypothetical protein